MRNRFLFALLLLMGASAVASAQEAVNEEINNLVRKHGLEQSQAMDIAGWMTDVHGPRLTGSPKLDEATAWATKTLKDWGMTNVHLESWGPLRPRLGNDPLRNARHRPRLLAHHRLPQSLVTFRQGDR